MKKLYFYSIAALFFSVVSSSSSCTNSGPNFNEPVIETFGPDSGQTYITRFNNDQASIDVNRDGQIDFIIESIYANALWSIEIRKKGGTTNKIFADEVSNKVMPFYEGNHFGETKVSNGFLFKKQYLVMPENVYLFNEGQTSLLGVEFQVNGQNHIGYIKLKRELTEVTIYETAWNLNANQQMYL